MANPSIEQVTIELIRVLQLAFGGAPRGGWNAGEAYREGDLVTAGDAIWLARIDSTGVDPTTDDGTTWAAAPGMPVADVYGADVTAIEVVATEDSATRAEHVGDPVREVQDRPKLEVMGPTVAPSQMRFMAGRIVDRVIVSTDRGGMTFVDAPAPFAQDLVFTIVGYATRRGESTTGRKGLLWLQQRMTQIGWGNYLYDATWPSDVADFPGYYFEVTDGPTAMPSQAADLHAFSATVRVYDVLFTDDSNGTGSLTGTVNMTVAPEPAGG